MTSSSSIPTFGLHAGGVEARFLDFCGNAFAMLVKSLTDVGDGKLAVAWRKRLRLARSFGPGRGEAKKNKSAPRTDLRRRK
jgi:hypothetical protein